MKIPQNYLPLHLQINNKMKKYSFIVVFIILNATSFSQSNILLTDSLVEQVIKGNYNPSQFLPTIIYDQPDTIVRGLNANINTDSLHSYLDQLNTFHNRNTASDTVSNTTGIGAARRWAFSKFQQFSGYSQNRLLPAYLQFDTASCSAFRFRNILAVLPGIDTLDKSIIIIEAHIDSRCENVCDTLCLAEGMEDNGSGTAMVLELARVMSQYSYHNTIVFMLTVGEEQGLFGGYAFTKYCLNNSIKIKTVQNNDIVGGIFCGHTSSPPSCPGYADIDSTNVRIFSAGLLTSTCKAYARFVQLEYREELLPIVTVPMNIIVETNQDRTGRGGDHLPFSTYGFTAVRFTAANENGNANVMDTTYADRQHSVRDILGLDTNNDGILDSFFVDFDYLKRNTVINGVAAAMAGIGPYTPAFNLTNDTTGLTVHLTAHTEYHQYRVSVRRHPLDYNLDLVYTFNDTLPYQIPNVKKDSTYDVSIASVDTNGIESIWTIEKYVVAQGNGPLGIENIASANPEIKSMIINPNPSHNTTTISIYADKNIIGTDNYLLVNDSNGKTIQKILLNLNAGNNLINYPVSVLPSSMYEVRLFINNRQTKVAKLIVQH